MSQKYNHSQGDFSRVKIKFDKSVNEPLRKAIFNEIKSHIEQIRNEPTYQKLYIHCSVKDNRPNIICIK